MASDKGIFGVHVFGVPQAKLMPPVLFRPIFAGTISKPETDDGGLSGLGGFGGLGGTITSGEDVGCYNVGTGKAYSGGCPGYGDKPSRPMTSTDCNSCDPAMTKLPSDMTGADTNPVYPFSMTKSGIFEGAYNSNALGMRLIHRGEWIAGTTTSGDRIVARVSARSPNMAMGYLRQKPFDTGTGGMRGRMYCIQLIMDGNYWTADKPLSLDRIRCYSQHKDKGAWERQQVSQCRSNRCQRFAQSLFAADPDKRDSPITQRINAKKAKEPITLYAGEETAPLPQGYVAPPPALPTTTGGGTILQDTTNTGDTGDSNWMWWVGGIALVGALGFAGYRYYKNRKGSK